MCLFVDCLKHSEVNGVYTSRSIIHPLIAKKDMPVWKMIHNTNHSFFEGFLYQPNKRYMIEFPYLIGTRIVDKGYHAFRSRKTARQHYGINMSCKPKIVKFTIPKGAKYYIGEDGDIVSNTIIAGDLKHCH